MAITSVDHPNIPEYGVYVRIEGMRSILTAGEHGEPPMFLRVGEKMVVRFTPEIHRLIDDGWAQLVDFLEEPSASQYFPTMRDVLDMIDQRATTLPGEYVVGARAEGDRLILMVGRDLATARDIPVDIPAFADMNGQVADAEAAATRAEDAEANIQSLVEQAAQDAADAVTSEAATYAGIASAAAEAALDHAERAEQATVDSQTVIDAAAQVSTDAQSVTTAVSTVTGARDEAVDAAAIAVTAAETTMNGVRAEVDDAVAQLGFPRLLAGALAKPRPVGLIIGSSSIVGEGIWDGETRVKQRAAARLGRMLARSQGLPMDRNPVNLIGRDIWNAVISGGAIADTTVGLGHRVRFINDGESVTITSPGPCTGFWVGLREGVEVGTVTVSVDGGAAETIPLRTGPVAYPGSWNGDDISRDVAATGQWQSEVLPRGFHSIVITSTGGQTAIDFAHIFDGDQDEGAVLLNAGWSGSHIFDHVYYQSIRQRLWSIQPDFIIFYIGGNEQNSNMTEALFIDALTNLEKHTRFCAGEDVPILFVTQRGYGTPDYDRGIIHRNLTSLVADYPYRMGYVNGDYILPADAEYAHTVAGVLASDRIHPSEKGHAILGDALGRAAGAWCLNGRMP